MIQVLIVEDQRMAREDMENYIQSSGRYCLAASITNAAMAETVCRQSGCELVLMDAVSYTHLDVYKRQADKCRRGNREIKSKESYGVGTTV